jgi:outer membrane protein
MPRPSLAIALLASLLLVPAHAQSAETIGFVNMQKVLEDSKLGQRLQEQLRAEFEPRGQTLGKEEQEIRQLQATLERDGPLMSAEQVSKKEDELKTRIEAFQEQAKTLQQEILKVQQEKSREILDPARAAIKAVATKNKVSMVLEPGMSGLLYIDDSLDLTSDVIKSLDASTK